MYTGQVLRDLWTMFLCGIGFTCLCVAIYVWWHERPWDDDDDEDIIPFDMGEGRNTDDLWGDTEAWR